MSRERTDDEWDLVDAGHALGWRSDFAGHGDDSIPFTWDDVRAEQRKRAARAAVEALVAALRVVVPLAVSAQVGRCFCGRAIPWERWMNHDPSCYECVRRDAGDDYSLRILESEAVRR